MLRRMFVDPGSISAGWALAEGVQVLCSGTIDANARADASVRMAEIGRKFQAQAHELQTLGFNWSESCIERIPNACALETHHAVGVIRAALSPYSKVRFDPLLIPSAWQKYCGWEREIMNKKTARITDIRVGHGLKLGSPLAPHVPLVMSKDELAARGLALFYSSKRKE